MKLVNYSLQVGSKVLISNLTMSFEKNVINHLLGSNGSGKSCFAKSCVGLLKSTGGILDNENGLLVSSATNVPSVFHIDDIVDMVAKKFNREKVLELYSLLKLENVPKALPVKKMSDGQKQKIKLLAFLSASPRLVLLDELTNTLDKASALDLYAFLREYVKRDGITMVNITHNLADVENLPGAYFYLTNQSIVKIATRDEAVNAYIRGGLE